MITLKSMPTGELNDGNLVAGSLSGNRDAFRLIVEKYQSLVCSLAYSATGNISQSEDIAQESFVTAWKQLHELREPAKLRPWLCQITRFLISKEFRRQGREPVCHAGSLELIENSTAPQPGPPEQVISEEEKALLWRALERIPEIYREPLVLFYREHQCIETVARDLELSEDAVKQRLSRGRKLLQEEFLDIVAGALKQSNPGKTFTCGVMAALPLFAVLGKTATVGAAAGKGSTAAKAASGMGGVGAFFSAGILMLFSLFGVFGYFGRWFGRKMGRASEQTVPGRRRIIRFWKTLAIGFLLLILPSMLVRHGAIDSHPWLFRFGTWSITGYYGLAGLALVTWLWQRRRDSRKQTQNPNIVNPPTSTSYNLWVTLGMLGPACIVATFVYAMFFTDWAIAFRSVTETQALKLIKERQDAGFSVYEYLDGSQTLTIILPEDRRHPRSTSLSGAILSQLSESGMTYRTEIEDRDFHNGGVRGWLVLLCTAITVAGGVVLLRRPGTKMYLSQESDTPRAEHRELMIISILSSTVLIALSALFLLFAISHAGTKVTESEAKSIISQNPGAKIDLMQYADGSQELWITPKESRTYPRFKTEANNTTPGLLRSAHASFNILVQGKDFGYRGPGGWTLILCSLILAASGIYLLMRQAGKTRLLKSSSSFRA